MHSSGNWGLIARLKMFENEQNMLFKVNITAVKTSLKTRLKSPR